MKSFIHFSLFLTLLSILPITSGEFNKNQFDPVEQLKRTGSGEGLDFTGRDLRQTINELNANPGISYNIKSFAWILGLAANKPFKINLESANLKGADLSGTNLIFANLSNAQCDEKTNFSETRFSNGSAVFDLNAKLTGIKGLEKANVTGALFLRGQLDACLPKGYKESEFAKKHNVELRFRK